MTKAIMIACAVLAVPFLSCSIQKDSLRTVKIKGYSSYNSSHLPHRIRVTKEVSKYYDSLIDRAAKLIGFPDNDIEVLTVSQLGAFSATNTKNDKRYFFYNPIFFDSVYKTTKTNYAIMSICYHELAHHFYHHALKSSQKSHLYEAQADRFSGFQLSMIGAGPEESIMAIQHFGNDKYTPTHADKTSRIAHIVRGYTDEKIYHSKDSSYLILDSILKSQELQNAISHLQENHKSLKDILSDITNFITSKEKRNNTDTSQLYSFYGDVIQLTPDNKIKRHPSKTKIGDVTPPTEEHGAIILSLDGVIFYLENDIIYSINPAGFKLEVGTKLTK